jgi:lysophospholipase L1-like esterase
MVRAGERATRRGRALALLLAVTAVAAACTDRDEPLEPRPEPLLERYVALGNSITASFQSGGLHEDMQNEAYSVLLARKANASFGVPAFLYPGCPPPLAAPLTARRISETLCAGRVLPFPELVQNLAVPGATLADALERLPPDLALAPLILPGRSQVEAMTDARPTLVSVWLGNNDALRAALEGDTTLLTPLADFRAAYDQVVDAIAATPAQDAILMGVADAVLMAPALQPGAYFWALARLPDPPVALSVDDDCAPFLPDGSPNPGGLSRMVSFLLIFEHLETGAAGSAVISCAADAPFVVDQAEQAVIADRVARFNDHIRQRAEEQGWIYLEPGPALVAPALTDPDRLRKCQQLDAAHDETSFLAAVEASCPGPSAPNFFGAYFSYDGFHPSSAAHAVIADTLAARLNAKHNLGLPTGH